ncbi:MAG: hypothetical protein ACI8UO_006550 [Verrucomicrobiales bacterium]|jgi:hypothetical protein
MAEVAQLPLETARALGLHEGEQADARVEVLGGMATISIVTRTVAQRVSPASRPAVPDLQAELREIYGDKVIPGPNPVLEERNESQW